ncbi:DUF3426 domain-containing protein [Undibacterium sp.]|uniref:DUF3426 domain-containing protein n=1 Tax=Undibacterium sp. TaxID=1914977 RepID=UPI002732181C|nr:DUF3426 domain-containing protein [Undibacterium sp.]MDP1976323.1 DUF3426 domain-containing protein [Undibacterium sp.]
MALATRCPHCQTAFKVANDQLKLHAGLVRCGSCQQTFNAVENLLPGEGQKPVPVPAATKPANVASATSLTAASPAVAPVIAAASVKPVTPVAPAKPQVSAAQPISAPTAKPVIPATVSKAVAENKAEAKTEAKPVTEEYLASLIEPEPDFEQTRIIPPIPVAPVGRFFPPAALPEDNAILPDSLAPPERPAPVGKPGSATARPATEVLAAISKAELEFEAETFDMPRDVKAAVNPVQSISPAPVASTIAAPQLVKPVPAAAEQSAVAKHVVHKAEAVSRQEPTLGTSSALDFDLGDGGFFLPVEEVHETDIARMELETRAALMDPPTADWSVSEVSEETNEKIAQTNDKADDKANEFAATEMLSASSISKVWRHKDHGDVAEPGDAVSLNDAVEEVADKEPHLGNAESALARQAAISEDSSSDPEVEQEKPNFVIQAEKQRGRKRMANIMLVLMIVLLMPLLLAQSAYILRNHLAARLPQSKPWLLQACTYLNCQVTLPAQIEKIVVDSNELQNLAPERNVFMLVMQIQNQSDVAQTWPNIELVLNDIKDKPLLQRAFTPADYLTEKDKLEKGFAAGGEQNIKLYFELPAVKAAGFHVGVFYP